jgi:hypothetical protein
MQVAKASLPHTDTERRKKSKQTSKLCIGQHSSKVRKNEQFVGRKVMSDQL